MQGTDMKYLVVHGTDLLYLVVQGTKMKYMVVHCTDMYIIQLRTVCVLIHVVWQIHPKGTIKLLKISVSQPLHSRTYCSVMFYFYVYSRSNNYIILNVAHMTYRFFYRISNFLSTKFFNCNFQMNVRYHRFFNLLK